MRTFAAILTALAVLHASADAQTTVIPWNERDDPFGTIDYKACEAKPRWLLVTVVEQEVQIQDDDGLWKRVDSLSYIREDTRLLDRCDFSSITGWTGTSGKARTRIVESSPGSVTTYGIKESLEDICSVLPACADATSLKGKQ